MDVLHGWADRYGRLIPCPGNDARGRVMLRGGAATTGSGPTGTAPAVPLERCEGSGSDGRDDQLVILVPAGPVPPDGHTVSPGRVNETGRAMLHGRVNDAGSAVSTGWADEASRAMLRGQVDEASRAVLRGWAFDEQRPARPVSLLVMLDGALLGRVVANRFRQDLLDAGIGAGRHGFELRFEARLSPLRAHQIRVLREEDGTELAGSPWIVEAAHRLDGDDLRRLSGLLLDGLDDDPALLEQRAGFLIGQLDRMLATRTAAPDAAGWHGARRPIAASPTVPVQDKRRLVLVVDEVMPDGTRDAGSNAILSHMRSFLRLGLRVLFAAADPSPAPVLATALSAHGIEICAAPFFATVEEVLKRHGAALSVVYLHRGSLGSRYARLVRHHCRHARLLLSVADLEHLRLSRQARFEQRDELLPPARQARTQELDAMAQADAVLTHSAEEAATIRHALPNRSVHQAMWTTSTVAVRTGFDGRSGVAFLADYAHAPNLDAARRLVDEIMPLVWEHEPDLPCLLAGSRLPHGFGAQDRRVRWIGHVPTLQDLFERVRLTVAPLAFGAGIKGKVLDSLSAGVPCVCSPIAAEGLKLPAPLLELVADNTHGIARLIVQLHRDAALNARAARAGLDWATANLSETRLDAVLGAAISGTATVMSDG